MDRQPQHNDDDDDGYSSRVCVYSALEKKIIFLFPPVDHNNNNNNSNSMINIFLIYVDDHLVDNKAVFGHYLSCRSLDALDVNKLNKICPRCLLFFSRKTHHQCSFICKCGEYVKLCSNDTTTTAATNTTSSTSILPSFSIPKLECKTCNNWFWNTSCLNRHKQNGTCKRLLQLAATAAARKNKQKSQQKTHFCRICRAKIEYSTNNNNNNQHVCYIQKPNQKKCAKIFYCFYDFETTCDIKSNEFIPTLCCSIIHCDKCWREQTCANAEEEENMWQSAINNKPSGLSWNEINALVHSIVKSPCLDCDCLNQLGLKSHIQIFHPTQHHDDDDHADDDDDDFRTKRRRRISVASSPENQFIDWLFAIADNIKRASNSSINNNNTADDDDDDDDIDDDDIDDDDIDDDVDVDIDDDDHNSSSSSSNNNNGGGGRGYQKLPVVIVIVAHNFGRFDGLLILKALLQNEVKFKHLERNGNIIMIEIRCSKWVILRFIDSFAFLPIKLADFTKTFNLNTKLMSKGHFPHLLQHITTKDESALNVLNYTGKYPSIESYSTERMSTKEISQLQLYLQERYCNNDTFNYKAMLTLYCINDCRILSLGMMSLEEEIVNLSSSFKTSPFIQVSTLAGLSQFIYLSDFYQPNTIAILPEHGFQTKTSFSNIATVFLQWLSNYYGIPISHAGNEGERFFSIKRKEDGSHIRRIRPDGYLEYSKLDKSALQNLPKDLAPYSSSNTFLLIDVNGCHWHGHSECMSSTRVNHQLNKTYGQLHEETVKKVHDVMEDDRYRYYIIYTCEIEKMKKSHPAFSVSYRQIQSQIDTAASVGKLSIQ